MAVALDAPSVDALCRALRTTGASLSAVMREVPDPTPTAIGHWSIGETAAHVSGSAAVFADTVRGEVAPHPLRDVDAANARWLAKSPERDPRLLADRLEAGDDALVLLAQQAGGDPLVVPFEGLEVPLSTVLANGKRSSNEALRLKNVFSKPGLNRFTSQPPGASGTFEKKS